jgi:anti-sigma B factor antagonist
MNVPVSAVEKGTRRTIQGFYMKIDISSEKIEAGFLIRLKGDVDMNTSPDVRGGLADVFKQGESGFKALFIDLSQVRYMDSSGIATLVEAMQTCMKRGIRLRLVDLSPPVRDVFELARLAAVFEIFPTIAEAVTKL